MIRGIAMIVASIAVCGCQRGGDPVLAGGKSIEGRLQALRDPNPKIRREAAEKLGNVGPSDAQVVPALRTALADKDARVRSAAILALVKCGDAAAPTLSVLTDLQTKDPDRQVREYAKEAVSVLQRDGKTGS
jgi:HEAT repeat protein